MIQKKLLPLYLLLILFAALEGKTEASWYEKNLNNTKKQLKKCKKSAEKFIDKYPKTSIILGFAAIAGIIYGGHSLYQWNERQLAVERERVERERERVERERIEAIKKFLDGILTITPDLKGNIAELKDKIDSDNNNNKKEGIDYQNFEKTISSTGQMAPHLEIKWSTLKAISEKELTSAEFDLFLNNMFRYENNSISFNKDCNETVTQILQLAVCNHHIYTELGTNPQKFPNAAIICKKIIHFILNKYSFSSVNIKAARRR